MRKQWITKTCCTLLAGIMILGLTACGNSGQESTVLDEKQSSVTSDEKQETSTSTQVQKTEEIESGISYPLETSDELSMWCGNLMTVHADYQSWEESPFHSGLVEKTGVTIDWQYPTQGADVKQAYNLLLADEELPDIIYWNIDASGAQQLIADGVIYPSYDG